MDIKQVLLERYKNIKLIYPFPEDKHFSKFIFSYIMDELSEDPEYKDNLIEITANSDEITTGQVFGKLEQIDGVMFYNYSFNHYKGKPKIHKLIIYTEDENFRTACDLVSNKTRLLEQLIK
jgi:hypothetical protein